MNEDKYVVLDINLVPMISRSVHNEIVKCFLIKPVSVSAFYSPNLFLSEQEIRSHPSRVRGLKLNENESHSLKERRTLRGCVD